MPVDAQQTASQTLQHAMLSRALAEGDAGRLLVRFHASVVDRYRERGAQLMRTRTVGRISVPGLWSLDLGITGDEVQATMQDLILRLPEEERAHWVEHLVEQPVSANFLRMRVAGSACIDDGDAEVWT